MGKDVLLQYVKVAFKFKAEILITSSAVICLVFRNAADAPSTCQFVWVNTEAALMRT